MGRNLSTFPTLSGQRERERERAHAEQFVKTQTTVLTSCQVKNKPIKNLLKIHYLFYLTLPFRPQDITIIQRTHTALLAESECFIEIDISGDKSTNEGRRGEGNNNNSYVFCQPAAFKA